MDSLLRARDETGDQTVNGGRWKSAKQNENDLATGKLVLQFPGNNIM